MLHLRRLNWGYQSPVITRSSRRGYNRNKNTSTYIFFEVSEPILSMPPGTYTSQSPSINKTNGSMILLSKNLTPCPSKISQALLIAHPSPWSLFLNPTSLFSSHLRCLSCALGVPPSRTPAPDHSIQILPLLCPLDSIWSVQLGIPLVSPDLTPQSGWLLSVKGL